MPTTLIASFPKEKRKAADDGSAILNVAECFYDTIQGENLAGFPSTFLRLQHCTLNCVWCDTTEVWRQGNPYSVIELIDLFEASGVMERLQNGQHLILTGGSPVRQQEGLVALLNAIYKEYGFIPFTEIENECTLMPSKELVELVYRWNNSPKTKNSGMKKEIRYKPEILQYLSSLEDSWFKFVVSSLEDWKEIYDDFLYPSLISRKQVVLMPEGQTRDELQKHYDTVVEIAVHENVRITDRMHVTFWNKKTGV